MSNVLDNVICNDLSNGCENFKVRVINNVNDAKPDKFTYTTINRYTSDVQSVMNPKLWPKEDPIGCNCPPDRKCQYDCSCCKISPLEFDPEVPEIITFEYPRYVQIEKRYLECGPYCQCKLSCKRQLSDFKIMKKVEVHYKKDFGFSVVAVQPIGEMMPIMNLVGTLMMKEEYNETRRNDYIFNNISTEDWLEIDIDTKRYSNVSRFINHSCDPNVLIVRTYNSVYPSGSRKISIPKAVLVACQNIQPGDDLFLDYGDEFFRDRNMRCLCYSPKCRFPPHDYAEKVKSEEEVAALSRERCRYVVEHEDELADYKPC